MPKESDQKYYFYLLKKSAHPLNALYQQVLAREKKDTTGPIVWLKKSLVLSVIWVPFFKIYFLKSSRASDAYNEQYANEKKCHEQIKTAVEQALVQASLPNFEDQYNRWLASFLAPYEDLSKKIALRVMKQYPFRRDAIEEVSHDKKMLSSPQSPTLTAPYWQYIRRHAKWLLPVIWVTGPALILILYNPHKVDVVVHGLGLTHVNTHAIRIFVMLVLCAMTWTLINKGVLPLTRLALPGFVRFCLDKHGQMRKEVSSAFKLVIKQPNEGVLITSDQAQLSQHRVNQAAHAGQWYDLPLKIFWIVYVSALPILVPLLPWPISHLGRGLLLLACPIVCVFLVLVAMRFFSKPASTKRQIACNFLFHGMAAALILACIVVPIALTVSSSLLVSSTFWFYAIPCMMLFGMLVYAALHLGMSRLRVFKPDNIVEMAIQQCRSVPKKPGENRHVGHWIGYGFMQATVFICEGVIHLLKLCYVSMVWFFHLMLKPFEMAHILALTDTVGCFDCPIQRQMVYRFVKITDYTQEGLYQKYQIDSVLSEITPGA